MATENDDPLLVAIMEKCGHDVEATIRLLIARSLSPYVGQQLTAELQLEIERTAAAVVDRMRRFLLAEMLR